MNHLSPTPEMFDRLVDGELTETERHQLLASLDQEPDGWRRCALAFLESQSWKKELGNLRQNVLAAPLQVAQTTQRKASPFGPLGTLMAMAASFLLVLGAGVWWQQSGRHSPDPFNQLAGKTDQQPATILSAPQTGSPPWQMVSLTPAGSTDPSQVVQLPALERDRIDEQWLQNLPSAIPPQVLQALRRNGYQVHTQEAFMPMPLKDGRRLVVPVDQVELKYVGNQAY